MKAIKFTLLAVAALGTVSCKPIGSLLSIPGSILQTVGRTAGLVSHQSDAQNVEGAEQQKQVYD